MPRSFLVKKYLKQKYDADQIKLQQALKEANGLENSGTNVDDNHSNNNNNNTTTTNNNSSSSHVIASLLNKGSLANRTEGSSKPLVTAPYTPLTGALQPLSVTLTNGYINDVTYIQTGDKTEEAMVPKVEAEVAAHENHRHHQPRRSVIVTNANHPANRHLGGHHDVTKPIGSPPIGYTDGEQFMPYDYSLPRSDRAPDAHAPVSVSQSETARESAPSPAPAHASSPASVAYAPLQSPPPAHHGYESQSVHSSPRQTPPHQAEFLPADHPFNHPLIQQLINQRLHVPDEKPSSMDRHPGDKSSSSSSNNYDNDSLSLARLHHQAISGGYLPASSTTHSRDFDVYDLNQQVRMDENQEHSGSPHYHHDHHHHHHHHEQYQHHHYTTSGMTKSASNILTSAHLAPIHTHHNPHGFPPSPSPTIPTSSPTLPYSESKSHFILPPPSPPTPGLAHATPPHTRLTPSPSIVSPVSPAPSPSSSICSNTSNGTHISSYSNASTVVLNTTNNNNNNNNVDDISDAKPSANTYTYDAFLISDGRSRKRSHEQTENREAGRVRYTCNECGKDYATSSNLSRHKQTHRALDSKNAKKCPHCDKVYVSMPALSMHILTHDLKHACNICGKTFSRPWLLQGHMRSHTGEKPFGCAHCGKAFADRSNLRAHMQTHSAFKHFVCCKCNKSFALKSYLNKHLESSCVKE